MLDLIKSKVAPRVTNLINESPRNLGKEKIMEMNVVFGSNVELANAIAETLNNDYTSLKEVVAALNEFKRGAKAVAEEQAKAEQEAKDAEEAAKKAEEGKNSVSTEYKNALTLLRRYKLIDFSFTDFEKEDNVITIYPTILYVAKIDNIDMLIQKINTYVASREDDDDEINED